MRAYGKRYRDESESVAADDSVDSGKLCELYRRGERVFAVAGCCHAVCHDPALRAALADAR